MAALATNVATCIMFINGQRVPAGSGQSFVALNLYTDKPWAQIADGRQEAHTVPDHFTLR